MSFAEVLQELPSLTFSQRQMLVRRALELDDSSLPPVVESIVDQRSAEHRANPDSAVPAQEMKSRLRSLFEK